MKLVEAYQAEDGSLHRDPSGATLADRRHGLRQFVERHRMGHGGEWDETMIADELVDNLDELEAIFR